MDLERFEELQKLMDKAMKLASLNKSMIMSQLGEMRELQGEFEEAIALYKSAIRRSVKNDQIELLWDSIDRCEEKLHIDEPRAIGHRRGSVDVPF